jgi:hypothetical protein
MEHATREVVRVTFYNSDHLILRLATVNHQGQLQFNGPAYLRLEGFKLFAFELATPVIVKTYFADGDGRRGERQEVRGERILYASQNFLPVGADFLGMETEHGTAVIRILTADVEDGAARGGIDGWQKYCRAASLSGSLDDGVAICCEFFTVEVAVGVYVIHIFIPTGEPSGTVVICCGATIRPCRH